MGTIKIGAEAFEQAGGVGGGAAAFVQAGASTSGAEAFKQAGADITEVIDEPPPPGTIGGTLWSKSVGAIRQGYGAVGPGTDFGGADPGLSLTGTDGSTRLFGQKYYRVKQSPDPGSLWWDYPPPDYTGVPMFSGYAEFINTLQLSRFDGTETGTWSQHLTNVDGSSNDSSGTGRATPTGWTFVTGTFHDVADTIYANSDTELHILRTAKQDVDYSGIIVTFSWEEEFHYTLDRTPSSYMSDLMTAYASLPSFNAPGFTPLAKLITDSGLVDVGAYNVGGWAGDSIGAGFSGMSSHESGPPAYVTLPPHMCVRGVRYHVLAMWWYLHQHTWAPEWAVASSTNVARPTAFYNGYFDIEPDGSYHEKIPMLTYP